MLRTTAIVAIVTAAACGPKQPSSGKPVAPPDRPIGGLADLAGDWTATDEDGWTYRLTIGADGTYAQSIERTELGPCKQKGRFQSFKEAWGRDYDPAMFRGDYGGTSYGGTSYGGGGVHLALILTIEDNQCNPDFSGAQMMAMASHFTGDGVELRVGIFGGAQETNAYKRVVAPAAPTAPAR
jgi:hypothetical protein